MQVSFINKSKTIRVYNLPHATYCTGTHCACSKMTYDKVDEAKDGTRGIRPLERLVCASVTLLAGEQTPLMPETALNVPEIRRDLDAGVLRLVQHQERSAPVAPPSAPSLTSPPSPSPTSPPTPIQASPPPSASAEEAERPKGRGARRTEE